VALHSTAEDPAPVRVISQLIGQWIDRLGAVWIEGQLAQISLRSTNQVAFLTLRDPIAALSVQVTCPRKVYDQLEPAPQEGSQVVVHAKPSWYFNRGTLSLHADDIRTVGVGNLLERIERLRKILAAEGLFDDRRKRALPFLPHTIGLICGRGSAAERDVVENAARRWPGVRFEIRTAAVQGPSAASQVITALRALDRVPEVEVVVVARGGGSVEDLLPFSDEALLREVAVTRTPVVSAIGHENDAPLLDLVADRRASTPTDASRRIVPDLGEQRDIVAEARTRARTAVRRFVTRESEQLAAMRSRPALAAPRRALAERIEEVEVLRSRAQRAVRHRIERDRVEVQHVHARVQALSPIATMQRGYAVLQHPDDGLVRGIDEVRPGAELRVRLTDGDVYARAEHTEARGTN